MLLELGSIFLNVITPVFACVLIGYVATGRLQLEARTLSRLAYFVLVPAFTFNVMVSAETNAQLVTRMVAFILLVHVGVTLVGYAVARLMGHSGKMVGAYMLVAVFGNVGNFGLPLIQFRLGEDAIEAATIYFLAIIVISFTIGVAAANWTTGGSLKAVLEVVKTPALLAMVPAILLNVADVQPPLMVTRVTGLLGAAMVPVMLVALGAQLAGTKNVIFSRDVIAASAVRLIGSPVLALLLVIPFGLGGIERGAGIFQAGMPAAILCAIISLEYDLLPDFVTTSVLFSTLASVITLTVLFAIV
jgi:predicted permease